VNSVSYKAVDLASLASEELISQLGNPNVWVRSTAQRLITQRQDIANRSGFMKVLSSNESLVKIHSLWCMNGLGIVQVEDIQNGLNDPHPNVRIQALNILETHPEWWNQIWPLVQSLRKDPDPEVRFHTALTLGLHPHPDNEDALTHILISDIQYEWSRRAVYTSIRKNPALILNKLWQAYHDNIKPTPHWNACVGEVAYLTVARLDKQNSSNFAHLLSSLNAKLTSNQSDALVALLDGAREGAIRTSLNNGIREILKAPLEELASQPFISVKRSVWAFSKSLGISQLPGFTNTLKSSLISAQNSDNTVKARSEAIELLGLGTFKDSGQVLLGLLDGLEPLSIQKKALIQLGHYSEEKVALGILDRWREIGPGLRPLTIQTLLRRRKFHLPFIHAIEQGQVTLGELNLDLEQRRLLREHSSREVEERAASLFGDEEYSNRKDLLDEWLLKMPKDGIAANGEKIFTEQCAQCHQSGNLGVEVGPNLTDMSHRSVEDLAFNILDPNMAINPGFVAYEAETKDGELLSGIIVSESPESVTLLSAQGIRREIARPNLLYLRSGGLSLMPEGLEELLSPSDLRDLISFLQTTDTSVH
jgi:putative heme-binding domain-containing protein